MINQLPTEIMDIIFKINREDAQKDKYQNIFNDHVLTELQEHTINYTTGGSCGGYDILPPSMHSHIIKRIKYSKWINRDNLFGDF